jgi:hypothetical protein
MIGERLAMRRGQLVIAVRSPATPNTGLIVPTHFAEDARKLRRVVWIVGRDGQRVQPRQRRFRAAQICLDFRQMALRWRIRGDPTYRGFETRARFSQPRIPHPHDAQLKLEECHRKRRDASVAAQAIEVKAPCPLDFAALGPQARQCSSSFKLPHAVDDRRIGREGFIKAPLRLQDCCPLPLCGGIVGRYPIGVIKIVKRLCKTMEYRAGSCARNVGSRVCRRSANLAIGQLCRSLIIADASEDQPSKDEQVDQSRRFRKSVVTFEAIDLGPQIEQSD